MKVCRGPLWALFVFLLLLGRAVPPAGAAGLPREIVGDDGAPMVLVPKGEFIMGSPAGSYIFGDNETPQRRVHHHRAPGGGCHSQLNQVYMQWYPGCCFS